MRRHILNMVATVLILTGGMFLVNEASAVELLENKCCAANGACCTCDGGCVADATSCACIAV